MLFEAALLGCFAYIVGTGKSARAAARTVGYGVGRAAGSLRRVRAEVDRAQLRVERVGGAELHANRVEVAERMRRMRAIQAEAVALLSTYPRGGSGGGSGVSAAPPPFSDEELAAALGQGREAVGDAGSGVERGAIAQADSSARGAPAAQAAAPPPPPTRPPAPTAAGPTVAYYYEGRPVVQATFEHVWEAGSAVPQGLTQQHVADAIKYGRDLNLSTGAEAPPQLAPPPPPPSRPLK